MERDVLNEDFARNLLSWKHSGFSINNSIRILDEFSQQNLVEYIARPPISLKKIRYEPFKGRVLFHTWRDMPWVAQRAPEGWKSSHPEHALPNWTI